MTDGVEEMLVRVAGDMKRYDGNGQERINKTGRNIDEILKTERDMWSTELAREATHLEKVEEIRLPEQERIMVKAMKTRLVRVLGKLAGVSDEELKDIIERPTDDQEGDPPEEEHHQEEPHHQEEGVNDLRNLKWGEGVRATVWADKSNRKQTSLKIKVWKQTDKGETGLSRFPLIYSKEEITKGAADIGGKELVRRLKATMEEWVPDPKNLWRLSKKNKTLVVEAIFLHAIKQLEETKAALQVRESLDPSMTWHSRTVCATHA